MLTTAFTGVAGAGEQKLPYNQFVCQRNGVELRFVGNQITPPLVYGDLVRLACLLLRFQQMYVMPGVGFFYLEGRRVRGQGHLYVLFVGDESGQGVGVE